MTKVVKLKVVKPRTKGKMTGSDIKLLSNIMRDLESGKVEEIAVVGLNKDGTMIRGWSPPKNCGNSFRMIGSMEKMREEYMRINIEE